MKQFVKTRWQAFSRTPFGCLLRLFITRMFHGGGEPGAGELDLGIGVIVIMLAMPGVLVSLLMFEKYGSLIRHLRGNPIFDPYTARFPTNISSWCSLWWLPELPRSGAGTRSFWIAATTPIWFLFRSLSGLFSSPTWPPSLHSQGCSPSWSMPLLWFYFRSRSSARKIRLPC